MKKLLLTLLLFIFFIPSCNNKIIVSNVYEKTYTEKTVAINDIYNKLDYYKIDSIPMNKWMNVIYVTDTSLINQSIIRAEVEKNSIYQCIYTSFFNPNDTMYTFLIRYTGREKYLKK